MTQTRTEGEHRIVTNVLQFPLRGVSKATAYRMQPEGTAPDMANIRAFDIVEKTGEGYAHRRARGGHRGGLQNLSSVTGDILDYTVFYSDHFDNSMALAIATTEGIWVGDDPGSGLTKYTTDDFGEDITSDLVGGVKLVGYKGRLYIVMDVSYTEPSLDDLPDTESPSVESTAIQTWDELFEIRYDLDGDYHLGNDLDEDTDGFDMLLGENGWQPIGDGHEPFTGKLYGQGYSINGLKVDMMGTWNDGLFGYTNGAEIYDVNIESGYVLGQQRVGLLIGRMDGGIVKNCHVKGEVVSHTEKERSEVGGLVGYVYGESNNTSTINSCSSEVRVLGHIGCIGGLCGIIEGSSTVQKSNAKEDVRASGIHPVRGSVGGLAGEVVGGAKLEDCYAHGNVFGDVFVLGGLAGYVAGTIENCYSKGRVLSGENSGVEYVGGLVGRSTNATVTNSFWDIELSGLNDSAEGVGLTTEKMQNESQYTGWNISDRGDFDPETPTDWWIADGLQHPQNYHEERFEAPEDGTLIGRKLDARTGKVGHWIAREGKAHSKPASVCVHQNRIVFGGLGNQPSKWYASRIDDPEDWDAKMPDPMSAAMSRIGTQDKIKAVASMNDGRLMVGCETSLRVVPENMKEGRAQRVADNIGVFSDKSLTLDGMGSVLFSDGNDLYRFGREGLENLSQGFIPRMFREIDRPFDIDLTWDVLEDGVYIVQSNTTETKAWFLDFRTMGLFPDTFHTDVRPKHTVFLNSNDADIRRRVEICTDGQLRQFDRETGNDCGKDVDVYILYPPMRAGGSELTMGILQAIWIVLDEDSGPVDWMVYTKDAFQNISEGSAAASGTCSVGGRQQIIRRRVRGGVIALKLSSSDVSEPWAVENIVLESRVSGRQK